MTHSCWIRILSILNIIFYFLTERTKNFVRSVQKVHTWGLSRNWQTPSWGQDCLTTTGRKISRCVQLHRKGSGITWGYRSRRQVCNGVSANYPQIIENLGFLAEIWCVPWKTVLPRAKVLCCSCSVCLPLFGLRNIQNSCCTNWVWLNNDDILCASSREI